MNAPLNVAGLAFGGGPLEGRKVVRFAFTDEGGISRDEPFVVVAGIFVHADEQLIPLENEIDRLKRKHIPQELWRDFVFHSTDIWSGKGSIFGDREKWPLFKRLRILHDLARVPGKLNLPIVYGAVERQKFRATEEEKKRNGGREMTSYEVSVGAHAVAFMTCTLRIEEVMRVKWADEVAQVVAEDNDQIRKTVKSTHEIFRDPSKVDPKEGQLIPNTILPIRKIRGSVHFADKPESKPLQLADLCAFVIRGHLAKHRHNGPLYQRIRRALAFIPMDDVYVGPKITAAPPYLSSRRTGPLVIARSGRLLIARAEDHASTEPSS